MSEQSFHRSPVRDRSLTGFTLIELIVTLSISGILLITVGLILFQSQINLTKGEIAVEMDRNFRFCQRMITKDIRRATGINIIPDVVDGSDWLQCYIVNEGTITYEFHLTEGIYGIIGRSIKLLDGTPGTYGIIGSDATLLEFNYVGVNLDATEVNINLERITDYATGATESTENSFVVKHRNVLP